MRITIGQRFAPFTHQPGCRVFVPLTTYSCQFFPTLIRLFDAQDQLLGELSLPLEGPIQQWTVQLDLERGGISVWGRAKNGYFRYWIVSSEGELPSLWIEKAPFELTETPFSLTSGRPSFPGPFSLPRLSFGCHKKQAWEKMAERGEMEELLPFWYRLGKLAPPSDPIPPVGPGVCLHRAREGDAEESLAAMQDLWRAVFQSLFFPLREDDLYQGIIDPDPLPCSPLGLLREGAEIIEQWFWKREGEGDVYLLPRLPRSFFCGRWTGIDLSGTLCLEWRKKQVRRATFSPEREGEWRFHLPKGTSSFRLREKKGEKGRRIASGEAVLLFPSKTYELDRFES